MKRNTKGFAVTASLWTAAAAGLIAAGTLATQSSATQTAAATAATSAATTVQGGFNGPADACTRNFSKDICGGSLSPGNISTGSCIFGAELCETTHVNGAEWVFALESNEQACATNGFCDQVPRKSGRLIAKVDYTQRISDPCPYRACISGSWTLYAADGTVYEGTLIGTIAAGTHRKSACAIDDNNCEKCLDAELSSRTFWRLGTEVAFLGKRADAEPSFRDDICFSLSGDFLAPIARDGSPDNAQPWRFAGAADGVHIGCP